MGIEELIIDHFKQEGMKEGREEGKKEGFRLSIRSMLKKGYKPGFVADVLSVDLDLVMKVFNELKEAESKD
jgi:predicted transposase YdaD